MHAQEQHLHDAHRVVCPAEADDAVEDGLLHGVIVQLRSAQALCQPVLVLPLLQSRTS